MPPSAGAGPRRPGPLAGLFVGAALGAAVFLLAALFHDRFLPRSGPAAPPAGFGAGGDARASVRVLATLPGPGVQAVLLPLREDGGPTESEEAILDGALFPSGPAHRWARVIAANPPGGDPFTLSLAKGSLSLETAAGAVGNEDLAAAFAGRAGSLPAHRALDLRVARVPEAAIPVAGGTMVRALVAFPRGTDLASATGCGLLAGPRLRSREVTTESLRSVLLTGRVDILAEADRAEARPPRGAAR